MKTEFEWPVPPHFVVKKQAVPSDDGTEPCFISTLEGRRQGGSLIGFDLGALMLIFLPDRAQAPVNVNFSSLKTVSLTRPIELQHLELPANLPSAEIAPASAKKKSVVHFKGGGHQISEVLGFVYDDAGLFLFTPQHGNSVLRSFIPATAIDRHQIGDPLGKMLVDERIVEPAEIKAGLEKQEQLRSQRLGDYLLQQQLVTQEQVEAALENQRRRPQLRIGEALLDENLITQEQLDDALRIQAKDRKKHLGIILVDMGVVTNEVIKRMLVQKLGIPFVSLLQFQVDPNLIKTLPAHIIQKYSVMPLYKNELRMVVAMENPLESEALHALAFATRLKIDPVMTSSEELSSMIKQFYGEAERENIAEMVSGLDEDDGDASSAGAGEIVAESDNTLVRLVNKIIMDAFEQGASDIHIESMKGSKSTRIRFRKDGVMTHYSDVPANFRKAMISRLKIMSRLDISEKRRSQDGKLNFEAFGPAKIELRVVTMPTTDGLEDVVMRILAAPKATSLDKLGLTPYVLDGLQKLVVKPHGLLFVCGPTGSGKTTTLHALLNSINTPDRKIWTVEDPIEITQEGLRQVQVQAKIDWTFAAVLRSFLRADPDVIMVGETRDPETAKTVIEASLTGHLVFSTMHTNSAVESVVRLLDLGLDPFNFADALLGVVGQRLARRLCPACRRQYDVAEDELEMLLHEYCFETELDQNDVLAGWRTRYADTDGVFHLFQAVGCKACDNSGYKGRVGVYELLLNTAAIKRKIHASANVPEILRVAISEGMRTLRQDGIEKIFQGHTDWEQIKAV
ncbi:Type II secretory pathway, ATPase PulE/Tfp pilus assembly pathway, ATPase PilB [Collimonas arenae]|uniref:Type II secretory pathway, ATPase PulE/Tfp pilus assembly pathway, ATPase PilB n=1 Tax=Collimonas arenae TaxID=279058 RepID=A0A0A1FC21_9BURK|nr:ATPase, T2SS/T4P/T4SS family [Collimonas arenae]AIY42268.1 Type II secretory pathway, ATPase PulE/Tfp pilus assembly pathway, ATPase PilB [Collimonas arenae]